MRTRRPRPASAAPPFVQPTIDQLAAEYGHDVPWLVARVEQLETAVRGANEALNGVPWAGAHVWVERTDRRRLARVVEQAADALDPTALGLKEGR